MARLVPPANEAPLDETGRFTQAWASYLQAVADRLAVLDQLAASTTYANDAAAAAGGVALGGLYRNGSIVQVRVA